MRSRNGYIKIHRGLLDWGWYTDANTMRVFLHLLLIANFTESQFLGVTINRGEAVVTTAELASTLEISVNQVRTALEHLKSTEEITITRHSKFSVVTLKNYTDYQTEPNQNPITSQSDHNQITITSHHNNNIINKEINNISSSARAHAREEDDNINGLFETFWNAYPKQCGYDKALTAFLKLNPDSELLDTMLKAIAEQKLSRQWQNVQYIPNPATWINGRRWNDKLLMADSSRRPTADNHSYDLDEFEKCAIGASGKD